MTQTVCNAVSRTLIAFGGCFLASGAAAATICVNPAGGGCHTTIQAAINAAAAGDTINVAPGTYFESLSIAKSLSLIGAGASATKIDGSGAARAIAISGGAALNVNLVNLTVQHGQAYVHGGGIANGDNAGTQGATLAITGSVITNNIAGLQGGSNQLGGGIFTNGPLTLTKSTVSNNISGGDGGGLKIAGSPATIVNSTFSGNAAGNTECCGWGAGLSTEGLTTILNTTISGNTSYWGYGGGIGSSSPVTISFSTIVDNAGVGISQFGPPATVKNTIVANNTGGPDCNYGIIDLGGSFTTSPANCGLAPVTTAALNLGPLQVNAPGATATHALLAPSAALNTAADCKDASGATVATDQRGVTRPGGGACDSGAFELVPPTIASVGTQIVSLTATIGAGSVNSLLSKLSSAQSSIERGNKSSARGQLNALINELEALVKSKRLDAATANGLIAAVQQLIAGL